MRYAAILFLFLSACNRAMVHTPMVSIEPAFQGYVSEFVAESVRQGRPVSITDLVVRFSSQLTAETLGECFNYHGQATNVILIDAQDWQWESDEYKRVVLFHELGHCVLNLEHVTTGNVRGGYCTSTSVMYPYIQNATNMYLENWDAYMLELFTGTANTQPCSYNGYWGGT